MTIAKNIVSRMNGDIAVESECGKGTKFVVTLFLKLVHTTAPDTEKLANLPVLVVDNELNREIAEEILGETGVTVESAEKGRRHSPDHRHDCQRLCGGYGKEPAGRHERTHHKAPEYRAADQVPGKVFARKEPDSGWLDHQKVRKEMAAWSAAA